MDDLGIRITQRPSAQDAEIEYLLDMIAELAKLARECEEPAVAIHLEAILAARDAEAGRT